LEGYRALRFVVLAHIDASAIGVLPTSRRAKLGSCEGMDLSHPSERHNRLEIQLRQSSLQVW